MGEIFKLFGEIAIEYSDATKGLEEVSKKAGTTADSLGDTDSAASDTGKELDSLGSEADSAGSELDDLGSEADSAGDEMDDLGSEADSAASEMDSMGGEADSAGGDIDDLGSEADSAASELDALGGEADSAASELDALGGSASSAGDEISSIDTKTDTSMSGMAKSFSVGSVAASGIGAAISAIGNSVDDAVSRTDTLNNYTTVMQNLGYTTDEADAAVDQLVDGIDGLPTTLDSIVSWQQSFTALDGNIENSTDLTIALNNATLAAGQGQETANSAMQAWYNCIAKGEPTALYWQQLTKAMPAQMLELSQSIMGDEATSQDLFDAWQDGTVTTEQVEAALIDLNENGYGEMASYADQAIDANAGIETSMTNVKTAITKGVANVIGAYDEWASDSSLPTISEAFGSIKDIVNQVFGAIIDYVPKLLDQLEPLVNFIMDDLMPVFTNILDSGFDLLMPILDTLFDVLNDVILPILSDVMDFINDSIMPIMDDIIAVIVDDLLPVIKDVAKFISDNVEPILDALMPIIEAIVKILADVLVAAIKVVITWVESFMNAVNTARDKIKSAIDSISKFFSNLKTSISNIVTGIKDTMVNGFNTAKEKVVSTITGIRDKFKSIFDGIKDTVKGVIDKIKGFFKFEVSLPKIKLPHFSITPKGWSLGDLLQGSIPSLGIEWYAKAMDDGMVMTQPTVFGVNGNGQLMAGGEAGSETVVGTQSLMNMITEAVNVQNEALVAEVDDMFNSLFGRLDKYYPEMANTALVMDTGAVVGQLAPSMDTELGRIARRKSR